jgi:hypothetical protein
MVRTDEELQQLNIEVVQLYQNGDYSEANKLAKQALEFGEKFLGPKHPITTTSFSNLTILNNKMNDHAHA